MTANVTTDVDCGPYLITLDSCFSHQKYLIPDAGLIVGRDQDRADIVVSDKLISRQHISIGGDEDGSFVIKDLNSTNGLFVNGEKIHQKTSLNDGDVIGMGAPVATHFRFQHDLMSNQALSYTLPSEEEWTIGRAPDANITLLSDPTVSALHARILRKNNSLILEDLDSRNGTFLNGHKLNRKKRIGENDAVVIGSGHFHFRLTDRAELHVSQRESRDAVQLECVGLQREIRLGQGKRKKILANTTLQISSGEFVGILGPSGAGKSTLLKSISGHTPPDSGCVLINETPLYRSYEMFRGIIGYVPQDDILHTDLAVETSLEYIAKLRLPRDTTLSEREKIVQTTIETLGLSHVKNTNISQLSGGQRKRVSIGAELITRPSILFLDEPTSGLDPSVEDRLMKHFQDMARKGTTVLITTHILYNLSMLDKIIFMSQGRVVFYGTPDEALDFFRENNTDVSKPNEIFDLLEGALNSKKSTGKEVEVEEKQAISTAYEEIYRKSQYCEKHISEQLSPYAAELEKVATGDVSNVEQGRISQLKTLIKSPQKKRWSLFDLKSSFSFRQYYLLSARHLNIRLNSIKQTVIYLLIPLILALVTLSQNVEGFQSAEVIAQQRLDVANQVTSVGKPVENVLQNLLSEIIDPKTTKSASELLYTIKYEGVGHLPLPMGMLLMAIMTSIFLGTFIACQEISSEQSIFFRERMAGQNLFDYIGSKLTFCFSLTAVQCCLYLSACYFTTDLQQVPFWDLLFLLTLLSWTAVAMGLFLSSIDPTAGQFSTIMAIIIVLPQLLLSGGLGPGFYDSMPVVAQFLADLFPARWGLESLLTVSFFNSAGEVFNWIPDFVTNSIGFNFGEHVIFHNSLILLGQVIFWLLLTSLLLKRK